MSFSIQTNVNSLIAQENLRVNSNFQSQTIQQLTSGYRINSSGDDPAGLAIANSYRSSVAEVTQGVRNANDGISTLQIIDGGMNNISQMLDRLRTLATQSASDTFTGSRSVPNGEFQSLLGEIDRQAQAIGLNTGGQFATSLAVYVGGGKAAGTGAFNTANGTVNIGLTGSAVDARALGLTGFQAVGGTADIGDASTTSTVSQIVLNAANTTQVGGSSTLYFDGPGFSDANKVAASINLSGVTDMDTLVAAVNAGIQAAGNGNSPQATAFKNANVVASAVTDANGTHLAFTSPTTAFQVQAGDVMANAFLGNLTGTTGNAIASTVTGGATEAATAAIALPVASATDAHGQSLNVTVNNVTTAVTLQAGSTTAAAAAADIAAAGVGNGFTASYDGTNLTISATGTGAQTVTVSDGAGQTGAATLGINNATASNAFNPVNVTLQITGAGLTAPQNITFSPASTTAAAAIAELQTKVNSNAALQTAGITVSGSAGSPLVFTSYTGETFAVQVTGDTQNALGLGAFTTNTSTTNAPDYTTITGNTAYVPGTSYGTANLEFSVNGAGTTGNQVGVNLSGGDATASAVTATTAADLQGMAMTIGVAGGSLNSGPVAVAFGADTAAALTGTYANVAGTSLTINNGGGAQTVNFAAATGASATAASTSTWNNAVGQTLTYNTGAGGSVTNQTVNFTAAGATAANATTTAANFNNAVGQTLTWTTGGSNAATGTVVFTAPTAATGATVTTSAENYAAANGTALTYAISGGPGGTINLAAAPATAATATAASTSTWANAAGQTLTWTTGGSNAATGTVNFTAAPATGASVTVTAAQYATGPGTDAMAIDTGSGAQTITFSTPADIYEAASQINAQDGTQVHASVNGSGNLVITSLNVGAHAMTFTGAAALTDFALSGTPYNNGTAAQVLTANDVAAQITAQAGTYLNAAVNGAGALVITDKVTGLAQTLVLSGAAALTGVTTVTAGTDVGLLTAAQVAGQITTQSAGALTATVSGTHVVITSNTVGSAHTLTLTGAADAQLGLTTTPIANGTDVGVLTAYGAAAQITANAAAGAHLNATVNGGQLVITDQATGAAQTLTLTGAAALTGITSGAGVTAGADAGTLTAYGVAAQITAQAGTYLNAAVNGAGALVITSKATGLANTMTVSGAAALTGIGTVTAGTDGDDTVTLVKAAIAAQTTGVTVSGTNPVITITDNTAITGTAHTLTIAGAAATTLGLAGVNVGVAGADTAQQQAAVINGTVGIEVNASVNASGKLVLTALDKGGHAITINDGPMATLLTGAAKALGFTTVLDTAVTTNTGTATSAQSVVNQLNNAFSQDAALQQAGLNAVNNAGVITIASANNTFFRLGTATSGANANLGFGVAYSTAQYGAGTSAAGAKMSTVDAQGVSSTNAISFAALADGSDDQALTISATDSSGALQSKTITLANDATAVRNGRNIDETVAYINTQLQQSANPTLQQIVAVKENNGSGEEINFLSGLGSFTVGVGSSANGNGLNTGTAETAAGNIVGTGSTISVDTQANALAAVTALSAAVSQLGSAQAAVGAGENQLNYSVGLAQSQIDNYSAAESRIRDADVAAEAANLTKAQVLQQTSLAAMAQANSAPQAVLALLRG